ncbi:OmpA family protein [Deltaproteobacteria bacterium OttesenSCG-928-M10]|nr:OmpA family protein [Deltaproteobacteria bacterium OttesenSCG-928-M10]
MLLAAVLFFRPAGPALAEDSAPKGFDPVGQAAAESAAGPTSPYPTLPPGTSLAPRSEPPERKPMDGRTEEAGPAESGGKTLFTPTGAVIDPAPPDEPAMVEEVETESAAPLTEEAAEAVETDEEGDMSAGARAVFAAPADEEDSPTAAPPDADEPAEAGEPFDADEPAATYEPDRAAAGPEAAFPAEDRPESFEELLQRQEGLEFEYEGRTYIWRDGIPFEKNADGTYLAVMPPENLYEVRSDGSRWLSREADGTVYIDVAPKVWASINFEHNSDEIMDDSKPVLDVFGASLSSEALGEHRLLVIGHTSSDGNPAYNLKLSRRRAQSVAKYLTGEHHIDPGRLILHGYGDQRPIADNETDEGRAANRRVEFILLSPLAE